MKAFLYKCLLFLVFIVGILSFILLCYGGYVDYFYEKFTTEKVSSMIIGDSRGLQGIQPQVLNSELEAYAYDLPILNYSFTIAESRIGPLYTKSIFKKLRTDTSNGIFIIAISPWMLTSLNDNVNEKGEFKEAGSPPHNMYFVDKNPNFEYLVKNLNYFHFRGMFRKSSQLHKNGWLEEKNLPSDSMIFKDWKGNQLRIFKEFTENYTISDYRKKSLDTLIGKLKKRGHVFLVRTPVDAEMLALEQSYFDDFDYFISKLSNRQDIKYLNFNTPASKTKYSTYDGHHIDKFGGVEFSKAISDSIHNYLK